jgi:hypothetical protein
MTDAILDLGLDVQPYLGAQRAEDGTADGMFFATP